MSGARPTFTVFTPTFNRAHALPAAYAALLAQTDRDFEWLIVDDGSTDGTRDLVEAWRTDAPFSVRYVRQDNAGKWAAMGHAVAEARGALFLSLDSDDTCVPEAIERLRAIWDSIPVAERAQFSGVTVHCLDPHGALVGTAFPTSPLDDYPWRVWHHYRVRGEKWGFHRTELLREIGVPVFPGERFVVEGLLWNRLGARYKVRHVNEALRRYHPGPGGLNARIRRHQMGSPTATATYYRELLDLALPRRAWFAAASNYARFARHAGLPLRRIVREAPGAAGVVGVLPGLLLAMADRLRARGG